jgi:hypothetical protein
VERADAVADECAFTYIYVVAPRPLGQSPCLRNSFMVAGNHGFVIVHIRYTHTTYRAQRERDMYYRQPERVLVHACRHTHNNNASQTPRIII